MNEQIKITLIRVSDGATVVFEETHPYTGEGFDDSCAFVWSEGNWGCDCNRLIEWIRHVEKREVREGEATPCGTGAFLVTIEGADGRAIYIDDARRFTSSSEGSARRSS